MVANFSREWAAMVAQEGVQSCNMMKRLKWEEAVCHRVWDSQQWKEISSSERSPDLDVKTQTGEEGFM